MPGDGEVVEGVAEDDVELLLVLVPLDELAGVAQVGDDRRVAGEPERLVVGLLDGRVDLGDLGDPSRDTC